MSDIDRLFAAFLAPALLVSATALLILSINVRLMGMVSRLRQYVHAKYEANKANQAPAVAAYTSQIESIERRAELIRHCFLCALTSLAGSICSCLLLGLGLYAIKAAWVAAVVFAGSLGCLLAAVVYYICEVRVSLSSVREEAHDLLFMDLGPHSDTREPEAF